MKYGVRTVIRSIEHPPKPRIKAENGEIGEESYFRRKLRLIDDQGNQATRRSPGGLRALLYGRNPEDSVGPFVAYTEDEGPFARIPYRFRALSETGDRARVEILARDDIRSTRHLLRFPNGRSFFREFYMEVSEYRKWHFDQRRNRLRRRRCRRPMAGLLCLFKNWELV